MDLYEVLGVRRSASVAEIRRAYQKLARALHPDLNPGDPVAAERFRAVSRAFEVLSDPERRAAYERGDLAPPPAAAPDVGFEGFDFTVDVRPGRVDFGEIFEGLRPSRRAGDPVRGEDLEAAVKVTFEEAFRGTRRRLAAVRQDPCETCGGSGDVQFGPLPCGRCGGSGRLRARRGHMIFTRRCAECGGAGVLRFRPCPRCEGEGRLMRSEWLEVDIPPGVATGTQVRVPGGGNAGRRGAPPGDFVIVVEVEPHPFYQREGEDLRCLVPVSMTEAALGAHIEVPTPDGPVPIEIPAGTQTGQRFRLRRRGMPRLGEGGRGDLYVEARVEIPAVIDDQERALLRELDRLHPQDPRREAKGGATPPAADRAGEAEARPGRRRREAKG